MLILVLPRTQKIVGEKISGSRAEIVYASELSGFKSVRVQSSHFSSGFKISGDMTKLGSFHFGFVLWCVNGTTNPVLKYYGFVTNAEQFPLL